MDCKTFMARAGVKQKTTVDKWLKEGKIPGVFFDDETKEWEFSESSRRPHTVRLKPNASADKLRASMLCACIKRHHISAEIYQIGQAEFDALVADLERAGLVQIRREGVWTYYDSTLKSQEYSRQTYNQIVKNVKEYLAAVAEAAAKGVTKAVIESASSSIPAA